MERHDVDLSDYTEEDHRTLWPQEGRMVIDAVIRKEMTRYELKQDDFISVCTSDRDARPCDKHKKCRAREPQQWCVFGIGSYCCKDSCQNAWRSGHSWVVIDLLKQCVVRRFGQQCRRCGSIEYQKPTFDLAGWVCVVRKLLRVAVKYLIDNEFITGRRANRLRRNFDIPINGNGFHQTTRVHAAEGCEFCQEYGILCTRFDFHLYESPEHRSHTYQ